MMKRTGKILILALGALLVVVPAFAETFHVTAQNYFFSPQDITVTQGDTVVWTNVQGTHNVHHGGNPSLFGNAVGSGWTYTFVFDLPPARYDYYCQPHQSLGMVGSVTVEAGATPYGAVHGQIMANPAPPDFTNSIVMVGEYMIAPESDGSFSMDSIEVGTYSCSVSLDGYETQTVDNVMIAQDSDVELNFDIYRLDPAMNLTGEYDGENLQITLSWDRPESVGGALDDLTGYEVNLLGSGVITTTTDTFYVYSVDASRDYDFWVVAQYDGGTADSSNHYRISVDLAADDAVFAVPTQFDLKQNYPNPFNSRTTIEFSVPYTSDVKLTLLNVLGQQVRQLFNGRAEAGIHDVSLDVANLTSGLYLYRLETPQGVLVRRMQFLK